MKQRRLTALIILSVGAGCAPPAKDPIQRSAPTAKPLSDSGEILLLAGRFDPLKQAQPRSSFDTGAQTNVFIVQFHTPAVAELQDKITSLGGTIYAFIPNHAIVVRLPPSVRPAVEKLPDVRWVGPYLPSYRLEDVLRTALVDSDSGARSIPTLRYSIMAFERGKFDALIERIKQLGGEINMIVKEGFRIEATLSEAALRGVVAMDAVHFIDRWGPNETDVVQEREIGRVNYVSDNYGYDGTGVRAEVYDAGVRRTHVEFQNHPVLEHGTFGNDSHGTSTFGINFASGFSEPRARGIVPEAQGIFANYNALGTSHTRYQHTSELVNAPYYAVYQSNSWGGALTGSYTTVSAEMDDIIFINDIVILQSMSNYGTRTNVRPQAWAKNVVSIGGLTMPSLDLSAHCWCRHGSIGPASDGRIKPELSQAFSNVYTTTGSSDTAYNANFGGTSAATPVVAAHFGIFFQMWNDGIFGNPVSTSTTVFGNKAHFTTAKAMMINTATQWDFSGPDDDRARNHLGWGFPNVGTLFDGSANMLVVDETDVLTNGQTRTYQVNVQGGGVPLRATLVYKDPMGSPTAMRQTINDLSLRLTSPSGQVFWGNSGLLNGNESTTDEGEDHVDTVENVFVSSPELGTWTVAVIGTQVVADTHPATPAIDADYGLVVSGINP